MTIVKCDLCRRNIPDDAVQAQVHYGAFFPRVQCTLCAVCAKPIAAFLMKHKFIKKQNPRVVNIKNAR